MREILSSVVKAELNHIYTEAPHFVHGGPDLGWFCREHALHLFVLALLLGHSATVIVGDFSLSLPDGRTFSSLNDNSDHAWCKINEIIPVDISVSTRYLTSDQSDIGLVFGTDTTTGGYSVIYHTGQGEDQLISSSFEHKPAMAYLETQQHTFDPIECLEQPFGFLFPPPPGSPTILDSYGKDVLFQITWHCYRLTTGEAKPLYTFREPEQAIKAMVRFNPEARKRITETLKN